MVRINRILNLSLACAFATAATASVVTPALADGRDCASNRNIWHVQSRLGDAIEQLNHDRRDYGGYRARAVADLEGARGELAAARADAIQRDGDNPACFVPASQLDGPAFEHPSYRQGTSDRRVAFVERWTERLGGELSRDEHDYAGHRVAAVRALQAAHGELALAERYAHDHGY